jgi:hypothetical protein
VTLLVAAVLVGFEGLALVAMAVLEVASLHSGRFVLGITTTVFFLVLGAGLLTCARGLFLVRSWARGPAVAVQLMGVLLSFSFWGGATTPGAAVIGVLSAVALVGLLAPPSIRAMAADDEDA